MSNKTQAIVPLGHHALERTGGLPPRPRLAAQHLWLELARDRTWRSLAIIPAAPDISVQRLATDLAHAACYEAPGRILVVNAVMPAAVVLDTETEPEPEVLDWPMIRHFAGFDAIDMRQVPPERAGEILRAADRWLEGLLELGVYERQIFAVDAVLEEITAMALCKSVDRTLLVVGLGRTRVADARKTIELVGRDRFAGVVSLR